MPITFSNKLTQQEKIDKYGMTDEEAHYIPDTLCQQCGKKHPLPGLKHCKSCQEEGERYAD